MRYAICNVRITKIPQDGGWRKNMNGLRFTANKEHGADSIYTEKFTFEKALLTKKFHAGLEGYQETPLASLDGLARYVGVQKIWVKDESYRFGLNAFKALGGSYAVCSSLAKRIGRNMDEMSFPELRDEVQKKLPGLHLVTATDGNHGKGIAWIAGRLGLPVDIYMPKGTKKARVKAIEDLGGTVYVTEHYFDETAREAYDAAKKNDWLLCQDTTTRPDYLEFPLLCMQGYLTMSLEVLEALGAARPTHIFIQAGAGSLAGSVIGFFSNVMKDAPACMCTVEAGNSDCVRVTAEAADGRLHVLTGDISTIMAGLSVGEPCSVGWDVLRSNINAFISCPDPVTAEGMRVLGNPIKGDPRVISGESGAVGLGYVYEVLTNPELSEQKKMLGLNENSRILCFSTEGDTDPDGYRSIVWDGAYPVQR